MCSKIRINLNGKERIRRAHLTVYVNYFLGIIICICVYWALPHIHNLQCDFLAMWGERMFEGFELKSPSFANPTITT